MLNKLVERLDRIFGALSHPTRRAILDALRSRDARISDLAAPLPMTFAGVARHVAVLEAAGLVRREIRGRDHWLSIQPSGIVEAERWLGEQHLFWLKRADTLAARLARRKVRR
jgi:DNA-binding transcriptional ArsR family regulator